MANTKLQTETLPLTIEGKIEMVPARQYANHKAATLTIRYKVDVKKGQITDLITMIAAGKELDENNEEVWHKIYAEIKEDIELAQDKMEEQVRLQNEEAAKKKEEEEAKIVEEKQLVQYATGVNIAETMATLGDLFDLGNMDRCVPKGDVTNEQLMGALVVGMNMDNFSNWSRGDLVAELETRGHEKAMVELCEITGVPYKSIYKMAVTAREVPPDMRKPGVSFTTYAEIASARYSKDDKEDKAKKEALIGKIGEKVITGDEKKDAVANQNIITTAQQAREAVKIAQGKPTVAPDPNAVNLEKDLFFVVNHDVTDFGVKTATGFPFSLADKDAEQIEIIHVKSKRVAYGFTKKNGPKWTALSEHKEPEPEEPEAPEVPEAPAPAKGGKKAAATPPAAAPAAAAAPKKKGKK